MTISEKVAYIKGLAEGLELDSADKNSKVLKAIIELLEDVALTVEDLEDAAAELCEQIDAVDEDLSNLEDFVYDTEDEYDEDDEFFDDDDDLYEVECPACHDIVYLDEGMLEEGEIACPNCGTNLEFDFEGCDCDCDSCESDCSDK